MGATSGAGTALVPFRSNGVHPTLPRFNVDIQVLDIKPSLNTTKHSMIFQQDCLRPEASFISFKNEEIENVKINDCPISVVKT